jgi:hypothetical protein
MVHYDIRSRLQRMRSICGLLSGEEFNSSDNNFDWLGRGVYFWHSNPLRGLQYASELMTRPGGPKVEEPYVVGAVIDCAYCLDPFSSTGIEAVRQAYADYIVVSHAARAEMPKNVLGPDLLLRCLDCAVIKHLHSLLAARPPFQNEAAHHSEMMSPAIPE